MMVRVMNLMAAASIMASVAAPARTAPSRDPHTAAAVLAADQGWTNAEIRGDAAFVDALLLPEYRSIGTAGKITNKAAIVAGSRAHGQHSDFGKVVAEYKATHPTRGDVTLTGDTAIVTWVSLVPGKGEPIASCDVFIYRDGHWRALYSQHSTAEI